MASWCVFLYSWERLGLNQVLPRQTCGLYTHTHFFHAYPGGVSELTRNIEGGALFFSLIYNPVHPIPPDLDSPSVQFGIFMTHQQNFANDRLAIYTFESLVRFVQCWTHLQLQWIPPYQMAVGYFQLFPGEKTVIWSVSAPSLEGVESTEGESSESMRGRTASTNRARGGQLLESRLAQRVDRGTAEDR
jgi:hypothetical protein